jgi:tRNA 5-methylaminomethyl-2-thiouridine biosynthesis bifunctional protein
VEKRPGYGRKRDMTVGRFAGEGRDTAARKSISVIGAGIAGLAAAWHLKRAGHDVVVYEQESVASGASGNSIGIINPKLTAQPSVQNAYYSFAYDYALRFIEDLNVFTRRVGSVHLETDAEKARKFAGYQTLGWHSDHMVHLNDASDVAGINIEGPALFYPDGAMTSPRDVCRALAKDIDVRIQKIETLPEADAVIVANAWGASQFCDVAVSRVRGQTTRVAASDISARVKTNICYGGYFTPAVEGAHMCGATFQPWEEDPGVKPADTQRNLEMLGAAVPVLGGLKPVGDWVGFRAASKDRYPLVGAHAGLYLSAAHGSHGVISGIAAGAVLAAAIGNESVPLPRDAITSLNPGRLKG